MALLLASLLWGTSFPATEWALRYVSAGPIIFVRFSLSAVLLTLLTRRRLSFARDTILAGVFNALAFGFQFFGQELTTASKVAIISNTFPIYTAALSPVLLGEYPTPRQVLSLLLGLGGVVLVGGAYRLSGINAGDVMNFIASVLYALYVIYSRRATSRGDPISFTLTTSVVSSLVSLLYLPIGFRFVPHPMALLSLCWLVLFPSTLGYVLYAYGISRKGALSSSILILSTVLFGAFTSMLLLGENLSPVEWVGLGLVALAILLTA